MFFNFAIDPASPYVGTGVLGSGGIPLDFFSDVHIRKGFAYVFNYTKFLAEVWLGEATQPTSPIIPGITYANATIPVYYMDIAKATTEFNAASSDASSPAYQVMTKGFYFKMTYNTGNQPRQTTAEMIKTNIKLVNPLFNIETLGVTWSTYLGEMWWYPSSRAVMPIYHIGWVADYPDAHNWVFPFMHTYGDFSYPSSYSNSTVDALIEEGISTPDGPARKAIYDKLQLMYYQDVPNIMIDQALGRRWERDWVQGWFYNAIGTADFYTRWEGLNGDITGEGAINSLDIGQINAWLYDPPYVYGVLNLVSHEYNPKADINPALLYIEAMLPPPGTSVGTVDVVDLSMINANWPS
jgi:peptide/nickel transport system substrate-binding protein